MDYPFRGGVLCAPDSFKGTLSAEDAAAALARGVKAIWPEAPIRLLPLADGGEGSLQVLHRAAGGALRTVRVEGPLGAPVEARFLQLPDGTSVVEMAQAAGLLLVRLEERAPEQASTFGVGELIRAALDDGAATIIVCLGGSATTDGGAGMAEALGFRLLDDEGQPLPRGGSALSRLDQIDPSGADPRLPGVAIIAATDVTNPLCGPNGAAAVYGPQKGADSTAVARLDRGLQRLSDVLRQWRGQEVGAIPGAGAAGGLGAGLMGFLGARIKSGAEVLMDAADISAALSNTALCLTGEGRIDAQSFQGKLLTHLKNRCQAAGVPLIAIGGAVSPEAFEIAGKTTAIVSATTEPWSAPSPETAAIHLATAAAAACRLLSIGATSGVQLESGRAPG